MFSATVKTKFRHDKATLADEIEKHRKAAAKKLGAEVTMAGSSTTSHPHNDGEVDTHIIELETMWNVAKPEPGPTADTHGAARDAERTVQYAKLADAHAAQGAAMAAAHESGQGYTATGREN